MVYEIRETETFRAVFESLEANEKEWIRKMARQLEYYPSLGKPLGPPWFREKKLEGKRLYFLVYEAQQRVLFVAFGDKKEQQKIIEMVRENIDVYRAIIEI